MLIVTEGTTLGLMAATMLLLLELGQEAFDDTATDIELPFASVDDE